MYAYVGSRTTRARNARGDGISIFRYDPATGDLILSEVVGDLVNPSYLARNRTGDRLYTVHGDGSEASAFAVHPNTGALRFINRQSSEGKNPVHLALDPSERFMLVSNHLSSTLAVLPIASDGALEPCAQLWTLTGEPGPHRIEQPFAKPHFNLFDPSGQHVLVPDKGLDRVFSLRFADGRLVQGSAPMHAREGAGPRHLVLHPHAPWVYVVNELDSTVTACAYEADTGTLAPSQILPTLADTYTGNSRAAAIALHPQGHTLYVSNRGEDSIAVFRIHPASGRLTYTHTLPSGGSTPRFFTLSPDARFLFALNETSDSIVRFAVDGATGDLTPTEPVVRCGTPVCMVFGV